jgi:hypothetical protein
MRLLFAENDGRKCYRNGDPKITDSRRDHRGKPEVDVSRNDRADGDQNDRSFFRVPTERVVRSVPRA